MNNTDVRYVIVGENRTEQYINFISFDPYSDDSFFTDNLKYAEHFKTEQDASEWFKKNQEILHLDDYEYIYVAKLDIVQVNLPLRNLIKERDKTEQIKKKALSKLTEEEIKALGLKK